MGVRYGEIKPDVYVRSFEPAADGYLRVRLGWWRRAPRVADTLVFGDCDDANIVAFAWIDAIEGEWPTGNAVLKLHGGPYEIFDGCDDPFDC